MKLIDIIKFELNKENLTAFEILLQSSGYAMDHPNSHGRQHTGIVVDNVDKRYFYSTDGVDCQHKDGNSIKDIGKLVEAMQIGNLPA